MTEALRSPASQRRARRDGSLSTRERILREASLLFGKKGYRATTTREIADAVNIRQPSLFHHFESKAEIVKPLLTYSLTAPSAWAQGLVGAPGDAAERLYELMLFDTLYLMTSPYDLTGLDSDDVMEDPEFRPWYAQRDRMRRARFLIVEQGMRSGEFLDVGAGFATDVLVGVVRSTVSTYSGRLMPNSIELSRRIASFALRGLLTEASSLDEVSAKILPPGSTAADVESALASRIPSAADVAPVRAALLGQ